MNPQARSYLMALDGNLFKACGRDFGKGGPMSRCIPCNKTKWRKLEENLQVGDLVIIKESNLPPATWRLGRISEVHPGDNKRVRVVTVRTSKGLFKRNILKLI
ncbi:hypothetical protein CDAR_548281 [Caerostris darwini]|uniref:DUF5641 domain-containing protein n=1 Tax=Caerostris darwini TaxID=1538125 RepID=A0AAV4WDB6_9ARAC|nr:hypothetical protein CDAR_548281 [Caerostris darwini]